MCLELHVPGIMFVPGIICAWNNICAWDYMCLELYLCLGLYVPAVRVQVAFRSVELREGRLLHNRKAVMLRGVNRHEHDDKRGKALSVASMVQDIRLMKQLNFNAVRCSHYPNHTRW